MTIFAALSLMLVSAFLLALLEAARVTELSKIIQMNTASVTESLFAEYQIPLWKEYHLLLMPAEEDGRLAIEEREQTGTLLSQENLTSQTLLSLQTSDVVLDQYRLITDANGEAYLSAVASYMKNNISLEALQKMTSVYKSFCSMQAPKKSSDHAITDALHSTNNNNASKETSAPKADSNTERKLKGNPLKSVETARKSGILNQVISNDKTISAAKIDTKDIVSKRELEQGTMTDEVDCGWYDKVLMQQYLTTYFSDYTNPKTNHAMSYELEYLLCGKESDAKNLEGVVIRLLAIREIANLTYLMTDTAKQNEAYAIATVLAGVTLNPGVIEVVKYGILAAWAYAESVLDVRALLAGDKISIIKTSSDWTSDIYNLPMVFSTSQKAKSSNYGLSYEDYLGALLLFVNTETLAYRAMDLQEASVRMQEGYEDFHMDHMILEATVTIHYQYQSIFLGLEQLTTPIRDGDGLYYSYPYSYRKAGA